MIDDEQVIEISEPPKQSKIEYFDVLEQPAAELKKYAGLSQYTRRKINKAAESTSAEDAYYKATGYSVLQVANPPFNFDELSSFYEISSANRAAINAKVLSSLGNGYSFDVTSKTVDTLQGIEDDKRRAKAQKKIESAKSIVSEWLEDISTSDTFEQVLFKVAVDLETLGNGYIEVGRTIRGEIGYIGHVPASTIRVRLSKDGFIQIVGNKITFFSRFGKKDPSPITNDDSPNELIHIKKYSPRNTFYGVPDSIAAASAIVGDNLAAKYNIDFFENAATPRHIITLSGGRLSASAEQKLFKFLQTSLRGNPHRSLFIPLPITPTGERVQFEMHQVDNKTNDSSFENYRDRNKQEIFIAHGVPESRIGGASSAGNAESINADRMFKEQIVVPLQAIFNKAVNEIVKEKTDIIKFVLNELSLTDELAQSQIDERYLRNRVEKPNEVRLRRGLPAVPEGDEFLETTAAVKADQRASDNNSRTRDQQRTANSSDSTTSTSGRNAAGEGRKQT